jgi:mono/diheme cytochrome c family protein
VPRKFGALALALAAILLPIGLLAGPGRAQSPRPSGAERGTTSSRGDARAGHGTPRGWKFAWPAGGNPSKGRDVFARLECYRCHEVKGENFPPPTDRSTVGPELSAMGPLHDEAYIAESIINPRAVIEKRKGYTGPDGSSKMPSFNDSLSVQDVTDLVAYLRQLKPPPRGPARRDAPSSEHPHQ